MSSDPDNPLLLDVLTASSTSYTANPDEQTLTEVKIINNLFNYRIKFFINSIQLLLVNEHY
jgi:hypothetical protein